MQNRYNILKTRHEKEFDELPIHFAFGDEQYKKMLNKLNVKKEQIVKVSKAGGYMLRDDFSKYKEMSERHYNEIHDEIKNDKDGSGFIKDMFYSELCNHEYGYTMDEEETLESLSISYNDLKENINLQQGLELAKQKFIEKEEQEDEETLEQ